MAPTFVDTEEIALGDGTRFIRTADGRFLGDPTPGQLGEIQALFSDDTRIALVRRHSGEMSGFEIDYFLRES